MRASQRLSSVTRSAAIATDADPTNAPRSEGLIALEEQAPLIRSEAKVEAQTDHAIGRKAEAQATTTRVGHDPRMNVARGPYASDVAERACPNPSPRNVDAATIPHRRAPGRRRGATGILGTF